MINKNILAASLFLVLGIAINAQKSSNPDETYGIKYIDIIHCTHTDYGYTDHPYIVEELQQKFLDIAVDAAGATSHCPVNERFYWTAEALDVVGKCYT